MSDDEVDVRDALLEIARALDNVASAIRDGLTSAKFGEALDAIASVWRVNVEIIDRVSVEIVDEDDQ